LSLAAVTIESLSLVALALAFVAGLVSFLSPCVLPLLPAYLSYISGVGVAEIESRRRRVLGMALAFVAGFTALFTLLGAAAGGLGGLRLLVDHSDALTIAAGVFFIVSGFVIAGVVRVPGLNVAFSPRSGGYWRAFVAGAAVTVAWTPCTGPVLGSIIALAGSRQSAASGAVLLVAYSLGLGLPFVLTALGYEWMMRRLAVVKRHYRAVEIAAGVLLIVFGVLLLTGGLGRVSGLLPQTDLFGL
jgi:cytochrome c-type biogenesis protein